MQHWGKKPPLEFFSTGESEFAQIGDGGQVSRQTQQPQDALLVSGRTSNIINMVRHQSDGVI